MTLSEAELEELAARVHKATPVTKNAKATSTCRRCRTQIKKVPGGHGPTWVHVDTGAVAASNKEGS